MEVARGREEESNGEQAAVPAGNQNAIWGKRLWSKISALKADLYSWEKGTQDLQEQGTN